MHAKLLTHLFQKPLSGNGQKKRASGIAGCPSCQYVLDRPHALYCSRCMTPLPEARGCNGCGQCRKR